MLLSVFALCGRHCMGTIRRLRLWVQLTPLREKRKDQDILKLLVASVSCCSSPWFSIHPFFSSSPNILPLRLSAFLVLRFQQSNCTVSRCFTYVKELLQLWRKPMEFCKAFMCDVTTGTDALFQGWFSPLWPTSCRCVHLMLIRVKELEQETAAEINHSIQSLFKHAAQTKQKSVVFFGGLLRLWMTKIKKQNTHF